jgi:superfamily I DNA/RNA helicase
MVWTEMKARPIVTFDYVIKLAQIQNCRIPCNVLLVDESQDLNACQAAWIVQHKVYGTKIIIVGDAAQCIFSFRGAKPKYMIEMSGKK